MPFRLTRTVLLVALVFSAAAPPVTGAPATCVPTRPDALGPFYTPGAPLRSRVGSGYVLTGVVRTAAGCGSIAGARLEFWMAGPEGQYADAYRATVVADAAGAYRFESHVPVPYASRPPHIHIRATAPGHQILVTQHYPPAGSASGTFDLVLVPAR